MDYLKVITLFEHQVNFQQRMELPPSPTPQGGSDLQGLLPKTHIEYLVPGSGVSGRGIKPDQPPDSLCSPPCAGYICYPGAQLPPRPQVPSV